jgi:thymidine kinase
MELTLILGPMKSGKSFELINHFMFLEKKNVSFGLYQSLRNVRDKKIWSRDGIEINAGKIDSLSEIKRENVEVVGVDEIHMFPAEDVGIIKDLLERGVKVIIAGLDTDYQGKMFSIVRKLLDLKPGKVEYKKAICEICWKEEAIYTQIFKDKEFILDGLPPVVPDDGTYTYKPVCKNCFKKLLAV